MVNVTVFTFLVFFLPFTLLVYFLIFFTFPPYKDKEDAFFNKNPPSLLFNVLESENGSAVKWFFKLVLLKEEFLEVNLYSNSYEHIESLYKKNKKIKKKKFFLLKY